MAQNFRAATSSQHLWVMWQPADHGTPWPDITEFFGRFGLRIFVGVVDHRQIVAHAHKLPNTVDSTFGNLNDLIFNHSTIDRLELKKHLPAAYFSKIIYHEDPTGRKWHTPMVFHFDSATQKFYQTKGFKKLTVLNLAGITETPVIVVSDSKNLPVDGLWKAKQDQVLFDFLQEVSGGICQEPTFGLEFWDFGQGLVPFLHKITVNPSTGDRADYLRLYHSDIKLWNRYIGKKILTDVPQPKIYHDRHYHRGLFETHELALDLAQTRHKFNKDTAAAIISQRNPKILLKLVNAMVWLSTDPQGRPIGAWFSRDHRYGVIFNNQSDVVMELPPGLLNI